MLGDFASLNGQLIPTKNAVVPIDHIHFTYGFGVYENLKVRNGKIYFVDKHTERLLESARIIALEHTFTPEEMARWLEELKGKNRVKNANIKMLLIGGQTRDDADLYLMTLAPKFLDKKSYRQGVHVITQAYERFLPQAKTLNMLPSYLAFRDAQRQNAYEALLIDHHGQISEGTCSNFFTIKNKALYTAPSAKVLSGVTRETVIACAQKNGYRLKEGLIKLNKIFTYDGAFLTNTSGKIIPIRSIDKQTFKGIPDSLRDLIRLYNQYLEEYNG